MIHVTQDLYVCQIRLARPALRNAFNAELITALTQAIATAERDPTTRVIYLSGEGPIFSAGADLAWMRSMALLSEEDNRRDAVVLGRLFQTMDTCAKPIVTVVQGAAMGGGVGLVAASDIAIAHPQTKFALTEVKLGLIPAVISPYVIRKIGESQARRYFLTAEGFSADAAKAMGLVHEISDDPTGCALELIATLLENGPDAIAGAKALIRTVVDRKAGVDVFDYTTRAIAKHRVSAEGQEGMTAFFEKRAPTWAVKRKEPTS